MLEGEIKDLKRKATAILELERWNWRNRTQSKSKSRTEKLQSLPSPVHIQKKGPSHCNGRLPKRYNPKAYSLQSRPTVEYAQSINTLHNTNLNLCSIKATKHDLKASLRPFLYPYFLPSGRGRRCPTSGTLIFRTWPERIRTEKSRTGSWVFQFHPKCKSGLLERLISEKVVGEREVATNVEVEWAQAQAIELWGMLVALASVFRR